MTRSSSRELKKGVWKVQVWLVTGYNSDSEDLRCGGSPILGPYMWVVESHLDKFLAAMKKRYGRDPRVKAIAAQNRGFVPVDKIPTLREELRQFDEYLAKPRSWT